MAEERKEKPTSDVDLSLMPGEPFVSDAVVNIVVDGAGELIEGAGELLDDLLE